MKGKRGGGTYTRHNSEWEGGLSYKNVTMSRDCLTYTTCYKQKQIYYIGVLKANCAARTPQFVGISKTPEPRLLTHSFLNPNPHLFQKKNINNNYGYAYQGHGNFQISESK